jgi:hypothetical protein
MRRLYGFVIAAGILGPAVGIAQVPMEASKAVAGGGISVPGWTAKIDANEAAAGLTVESAKFAKEGDAFHITTGPAIVYWNPANKASGSYTVKATFTEPKFQNLNTHPHPYGIVIGGNDMGTDQQSYLYCAAYGTGNFIVRGFGPAAFQLGGRRPQPNPAVNKAAGIGEPVTQEIAVSVKDDRVDCAINGSVVASFPRDSVVTAGRLKSTDGLYGIRSGHNTEVLVKGLGIAIAVTKN